MFPIRGAVVKKNYRDCWVIYNKVDKKDVKMNSPQEVEEKYVVIGALPPQPTPSGSEISQIFV